MHTEEEAKKKICPLRELMGWDSDLNEPIGVFCIASECMVWKWGEEQIEVPLRIGEEGKRYEAGGYCGLIK